MKVFNNQWTPAEIESLTINSLERAIESGNLDPLLINDGRIIGCEKVKKGEES